MVENVRSCDFCDARVPAAEFETGGAVVLLGQAFCPRCIEQTIRNNRSETLAPPAKAMRGLSPASTLDQPASEISCGSTPHPSPPEKVPPGEGEDSPEGVACIDRRGHERYIPPLECDLSLKPTGLGGFLIGNVLKHWLEISPDGLRAVVSRKLRRGDLMEARIAVKPRREVFTVQVVARHVSKSQKYPGSFVVGLRFVDPPDALRACIREDLCRFPAAPGRPAPHPVASDGRGQAPQETPGNVHGCAEAALPRRPGAGNG